MVNSAAMRVPTQRDLIKDPTAARPVTFESIVTSTPAKLMGVALLALAIGTALPVRSLSARLTPRPDLTGDAPVRAPPYIVLVLGTLVILGVLSLVYLTGVGKQVGGSERWLRVPVGGGQLSIQPSEFAKWGLLALIAWYGATTAGRLRSFMTGLLPALIVVGAVAGFVVIEDLGTGALIAASCGLVLIAAGANIWHFALFIPVGLAGFTAAVIAAPYRVARLAAFLDPYRDAEKSGFHMIQSMIAVANGGGPGRGLGHGLQKFDYLPEDTTDFLFAIICEELGIAGAAIVIGTFLFLICSAFAIVRREQDRALKLFGLGVIATVGLQALINLAVVTGLGPTKGIALPLVSQGGTGWAFTALCLGVLIAIDRSQPREAAPQPAPAAQPA
jgi:cell division protein FtsW